MGRSDRRAGEGEAKLNFPRLVSCMILIDLEGAGLVLLREFTHALLSSYVGCVAAVGNQSGFMYTQSVGSFTYGEPAPVTHTNPAMNTDVRAHKL